MSTKAQQYAEAIFQASRNKSEVELETVSVNTRALLERQGHVALLPAIVRELEKLTKKRKSSDEVVISIATKEDVNKFTESIVKDINKLNAENLSKRVIVDETLIGGYEVRANGERVDRTFKRSLLTMYTKLITNNL